MHTSDQISAAKRDVLKGPELIKYIVSHTNGKPSKVSSNGRDAFYVLTKPMYVFKKLADRKIANLIIPAGAEIYVDELVQSTSSNANNRKMRASEAIVHSMYSLRYRRDSSVGSSMYRSSFGYKKGSTVVPTREFSRLCDQCESGIHFFVSVGDALDYSL